MADSQDAAAFLLLSLMKGDEMVELLEHRPYCSLLIL